MRRLLASMAGAANPIVADVDGAADFAARQVACLPPLPRFGVMTLGGVFCAQAFLAGGGVSFHGQSAECRRRRLAQWRGGVVAPCRDFIAMCDSLLRFAEFADGVDGAQEGAVSDAATVNG